MIPSVSRHEQALADVVEAQLRQVAALEVTRLGDNVVARTTGPCPQRVVIAGHLDTVPGEPADARLLSDRVVGLGACDMKGSLAVMLALAADDSPRAFEVTFVFYAREEIARSESGLVEIATHRPDLLEGDVAVVAEPTGGVVEAGCQGTLRLEVSLVGQRAHTARPFTGRNAIHRLGAVINAVAAYQPRVALVDGIAYTEQLQVVSVNGGVAPNVVPDAASCVLNYRVAPDRSLEEASASVRDLLSACLEDGDELAVLDWAPAAPPSLNHPLIAKLVASTGHAPRAKVGWTDVATFCERGIPAANFGAGDPLLAHQQDEFVTDAELSATWSALRNLLAPTN